MNFEPSNGLRSLSMPKIWLVLLFPEIVIENDNDFCAFHFLSILIVRRIMSRMSCAQVHLCTYALEISG